MHLAWTGNGEGLNSQQDWHSDWTSRGGHVIEPTTSSQMLVGSWSLVLFARRRRACGAIVASTR